MESTRLYDEAEVAVGDERAHAARLGEMVEQLRVAGITLTECTASCRPVWTLRWTERRAD